MIIFYSAKSVSGKHRAIPENQYIKTITKITMNHENAFPIDLLKWSAKEMGFLII
jgi:hypothetical protein